jgi:hypothetical protein
MKWFEFIEDQGDGSSCARRFKTREDAIEYIEWIQEEYLSCIDVADIYEVDTEAPGFFDEIEKDF